MDGYFASWASMTGAYFASPLSLASGNVQLLTILPAVGMVLFVIGLVLALLRREKRALWLAVPLVLSLFAPIAIGLSNTLLGWMGFSFVLFVGTIGLVVWVGMIANDAQHRLPVWLIGLGLLSFVAYCALIAIALTWGAS
jgi:asparagine N-glycosylation enzyme membrane subunit Stt3